MQVSILSHLLNRQFISKVAFNSIHNILAAIVDVTDTIVFYHYQPVQNIFSEIFQGMSRPSGKKTSLSWSPDGIYLALGSNHLEIWKFDGKKIAPLRNFSDDFIDIKIISWSPDFQNLAYGGLSKKNTIKIRSLEGGNGEQIQLPLTVSAISYDPFGKYLLILVRNNILYIYNSTSLVKLREVPLSPGAETKQNINTVKQTRSMSWSPDFNHLVCPSLDDSKISLALSMCRSNNFKIDNAFLGHVSSISCSKFSPILYEWENESTSILALGDSHGVISLWRLFAKKTATLLLISNSYSESHQVVEELEWDQKGQILIVNVMKRYVNVLRFNKANFGRQITEQEKISIIQSNYGVRSANEIKKKQLQIFSILNIKNNQQQIQSSILETNYQKNTSFEQLAQESKTSNIMNNNPKFSEKIQYVKVNDQITTKDKNNRKRIQPAMLVRKEEVEKMSVQPTSNNISLNNLSAVSLNFMNSYQPIKLKLIQDDTRFIKIGRCHFLELKRLQSFTFLQLIENKDGDRVVLNEKVFTGVIDFIKPLSSFIYVLNQGNLYIFDTLLNLTELPLCIGQVNRIAINQLFDVYYLSTTGLIRGFNHSTRKCYTVIPIPIQSLVKNAYVKQSSEPAQQKEDNLKLIEAFTVETDHNLYVTLVANRVRYFYDKDSGCWVTLQLNSGHLQAGHSIKVNEHEERLAADFFRALSSKIIEQQPQGQTAIQQFESNLIYYKKHNPNIELYQQNLFGLIRELKIRNLSSKLRTTLQRYFINPKSEFYQNSDKLRARVKAIGGTVIQQFMLFDQL